MKKIKEYLGRVAEVTAYAIFAMPFVIGIGSPLYEGYKSEFFRSYNQAITRNADMNGDGRVTPTEEFEIRKVLHDEIAELRGEGVNLEGIVNFLKNR